MPSQYCERAFLFYQRIVALRITETQGDRSISQTGSPKSLQQAVRPMPEPLDYQILHA